MLSTLNARRARAAGWSASRFTLLVLLVLTSITVSSLAFPQISAGQAWTATWTPKTAAPVGPRGWVDGAYDSVRGRVMIFGGGAGSGIGDVWQYDTSSDQWVQLQTAPSCPSGAAQPPAEYASAYDPVNQLLWMFGGSSVGCGGLSLVADARTTSSVIVDKTLSATTPDFYKNWVVNMEDSIAFVTGYDPAPGGNRLTLAPPLSQAAKKGRYFLYAERGGLSGFAPATKTFTNVTGTTPEPTNRMSPALAYSTKDRALVMFGGQGGADTWAFDVNGKRWTQMTSSPGAATPPGLSQLASSMVYDGDDDVFVLFGGCLCTLDLGASSGDTWTYRLSSNTWTKVTPAVSPPARQGHHLVYDSANKRVILFGGFDATSGTYFNDVWIYSVTANTWSMVLPAVSPPARRMAAMVYDPVQQRTVLFGGQGPEALADVWVLQLQQSASGSSTPTLTSLSPSPVTAGSPGFTLTVTGANFASTSVVQWNGSNRTTTFVRATQLQASIATADIASAGSALVSASTPGSGGGTSNSLTLAIAAPTPAPILSSISPTTASAGGAAFTLTATGSNFTNGSIVLVNGASRTTTFVSSTQLTAALPASDIAAAGTPSITVFTPAPGGGTSGARSLTVASVNPTPTITSLSPASVTAGSAAFTLTVTGTGFATGATATVGGQARPVTVGSATQVSIAVQATDVASQGTLAVVVTNPASCTNAVCASNSVNLSVAASAAPTPAPILSSISPTTASAGGAAFTLTATGSNFTNGSIVQVNGASRTTTFVSSTQLTAALPASDIAAAGTPSITVFTPAPGGGTSGARSLTVASVNPTPTITSLSPASVTAGSAAFTLTVTGTGFATGATATVGGQARPVTVGSATQVSIAVQATDVASQGTLAVVVTNPASCTNAVCASNSVNVTVAASSTSSTPTSPVLYFTDLASGPRSGNGDTSKGQIANQDGALVTVWGQNLGTSQGTSTITLGGVTPTAIYYWGNATPPSCGAATLFNTYRKLQCITFQVDHATPPGAQNIVVTVNGIASNPVPFTVRTTGTIWFAASGGGGAGTFASPYGSIQMGVNALNSGDILYVKDGLNATGGIVVPRSSHYSIATAPLAIVAYPGAAVQVGDSTHDGIVITCSGCGYWMTYAKLAIFGASQAVTLPDNGRIVGAQIQTPVGGGAAGALGGFGSNLFILGDEFTNCGNPASFDSLYHVIYLYGRRSVATPYVESDREVGWSYFHGNTALRAINIYNGEVGGNNPITHHRIHDNVVVDQVGDGVMFGNGVVGENWEWNDLIINVGLDGGSGSVGSRGGIKLQPANPPGVTSGLPITMHLFNNTVLNAGAVGATGSGALYIGTSGWTPDIHNNIFAQLSGFPYIGPASPAMSPDGNPAHWSNNLWYGAGAAPAGDSNAVNADPKLVSAVSPYDLHLQATAPAIGAGVNMASLGVGLLDFDGRPRPASGAWGIGAYQASGSGTAGQASTSTSTVATTTTGSGTSGQSTTPTTTSTTSTGTTASSTPPPSLTLTYNGMLTDAVGQSNTAAGPDGALDGVMTVTVHASGGRTVTGVRLDSDGPGTWDTDSGTLFWVLGVAPTAGGALLNAPATMAVNFPVADGGNFVAFASDSQGIEFLPGRTLTLTATFSDGSTATAVTTITTATSGTTPTATSTTTSPTTSNTTSTATSTTTSPTTSGTTSPTTSVTDPSASIITVSGTSTFTRGTWTQYGTGTYGSALFRGNGTAPYDVFADGTTSVSGKTMQQAEQGTGGEDALLGAYSSGGVYVPSLQQFVSLLTTGHYAGGSNEVNVFDLTTGTWNPSGRPVNPTVRLFMPVGGTWPSSIAYAGIQRTSPLGLIDTGNNYSANIAASQRGMQIAPNPRQIYGGITDMPGFNTVFLFGGFGYWDAPGGSACIGATYNYVTKKYQFLDAETWPMGATANITAAAWDTVNQRVLFTTETDLWAYYPGAPQGSRVVRIVAGDGCNSDGCSQHTMLWDPKRKRAVLFGGGNPRYYNFAGGPVGPFTYTITGAGLATNLGPGMLYDPVADLYVHFPGGKSLTYINPDTWVGTSQTPSGGATPTTANMGGCGGAPLPNCQGSGMYYRFFYWPQQDAYVALPTGTTTGVYIFAPGRS